MLEPLLLISSQLLLLLLNLLDLSLVFFGLVRDPLLVGLHGVFDLSQLPLRHLLKLLLLRLHLRIHILPQLLLLTLPLAHLLLEFFAFLIKLLLLFLLFTSYFLLLKVLGTQQLFKLFKEFKVFSFNLIALSTILLLQID